MCFDTLMLINDLCVAFLQGLIEKRIRPWVNKKIAEYIGEPEPTLTDFICSKLESNQRQLFLYLDAVHTRRENTLQEIITKEMAL